MTAEVLMATPLPALSHWAVNVGGTAARRYSVGVDVFSKPREGWVDFFLRDCVM